MVFRIKKGDEVVVISGDDKGRKGKVIKIMPDEQKVVVDKINIVKKHQRARQNTPAGILEMPAPIHCSNLMLLCPKCKEATRIKKQRLTDKSGVRVCKKCEEVVDKIR